MRKIEKRFVNVLKQQPNAFFPTRRIATELGLSTFTTTAVSRRIYTRNRRVDRHIDSTLGVMYAWFTSNVEGKRPACAEPNDYME